MFQVNRALPKSPQQQLKFLKIDKLDWKGGGNNDGDGVTRRRADEGIGAGGGSPLGSCSEGVGQHERQDVMVYSAQEWGRCGQGAPCPQHQPQCDL